MPQRISLIHWIFSDNAPTRGSASVLRPAAKMRKKAPLAITTTGLAVL
jgi:hypothetical protein